MALNNFTQRTLSGALYVAVVVASILVHPVAFGIVFLLVSMLAVREFHQLMQSPSRLTALAMVAAAWLFAALWMPVYEPCTEIAAPLTITLLFVYMLMLGGGLLAELWGKAENPIQNWGHLLQSQFMIALPFALMNALYFIDKYLLLAVFVLIWVNDSGAYCVGVLTAKRKNGNHQMFPRVSPKKSWEGLFGGILLAMGIGALLAYFGWFNQLADPYRHLNPYWIGVLFALFVAVFGTLGDLVESLMKRTIGVKDSGRFLPGHGGVLDRFDSILLAVPATMAFTILILFFCL